MNENKFTVVISYFEDFGTSVCKYNSLREMLQDLFFDGYDGPDDEWVDNPAEYREDILKYIDTIISQCLAVSSFNIFYIKDNEIKELDINEIDEGELITAYLTTYE